jgi:membrane protein
MIDQLRRTFAHLDRWSEAHRLPRIARRAVAGFLAHEALQYAGSMAYFSVLSIFQLLVLAIVVGSFFLGEGQARDFVLDQVQAGSPLDRGTIAGVIDAVIQSRGGISIISFGFLVWSGLGVFSAVSNGISRAFEVTTPRPFWLDKLVGLVLMAITGVLAVASLVIGIVTGVLQQAASDLIGGVPGGGTAVWLIGLLAPLILIFFAFWILYRIVPNRPVTFGEVLPGAIVAALLWTVLRFGFTWYATSIANYDSAFGPISTGVTLLVFLYFASIIVLLGAEVARASVIEDEMPHAMQADPRYLPVSTGIGAVPEEAPAGIRRGVPRWVFIAGAAAVGLVAGRLSKRDDEYDD